MNTFHIIISDDDDAARGSRYTVATDLPITEELAEDLVQAALADHDEVYPESKSVMVMYSDHLELVTGVKGYVAE